MTFQIFQIYIIFQLFQGCQLYHVYVHKYVHLKELYDNILLETHVVGNRKFISCLFLIYFSVLLLSLNQIPFQVFSRHN